MKNWTWKEYGLLALFLLWAKRGFKLGPQGLLPGSGAGSMWGEATKDPETFFDFIRLGKIQPSGTGNIPIKGWKIEIPPGQKVLHYRSTFKDGKLTNKGPNLYSSFEDGYLNQVKSIKGWESNPRSLIVETEPFCILVVNANGPSFQECEVITFGLEGESLKYIQTI